MGVMTALVALSVLLFASVVAGTLIACASSRQGRAGVVGALDAHGELLQHDADDLDLARLRLTDRQRALPDAELRQQLAVDAALTRLEARWRERAMTDHDVRAAAGRLLVSGPARDLGRDPGTPRAAGPRRAWTPLPPTRRQRVPPGSPAVPA
jgi:hypothetical protein